MPVVVPNGYEKQWTEQVKDSDELKGLLPIMMGWTSNGWVIEDITKKQTDQMSFFQMELFYPLEEPFIKL